MRNCNDQQKRAGNADASSHSTARAAAAIICGKPKDLKINKDNRMWRKINGGENIARGKVGKELNAKIGQGIERKWQNRLMCVQNKNNNKIPQKQAWRRGAGWLCCLMLMGTCWQVTGLPREKMLVGTRVVRFFFFFWLHNKMRPTARKAAVSSSLFPIAFPRFRGISRETIRFAAH